MRGELHTHEDHEDRGHDDYEDDEGARPARAAGFVVTDLWFVVVFVVGAPRCARLREAGAQLLFLFVALACERDQAVEECRVRQARRLP